MSKKRSKRYSQAEREELVELFRQSGMSHWRFCKEMDLGYETLRRWLKEESSHLSLVEVTAAEAPLDRSVELTVRLPNGLACELGPAVSPQEALNWIRELKTC
jgi:transposase-like protein